MPQSPVVTLKDIGTLQTLQACQIVPGYTMPEGVLVRPVRGGAPDAYEVFIPQYNRWGPTRSGEWLSVGRAPHVVDKLDGVDRYGSQYELVTEGADAFAANRDRLFLLASVLVNVSDRLQELREEIDLVHSAQNEASRELADWMRKSGIGLRSGRSCLLESGGELLSVHLTYPVGGAVARRVSTLSQSLSSQ